MTTVRINRAPVLTLWAAVVAERLGSPRDTALTCGQAVAGMTAHAKGVRLGIYAQPEERPHGPPPQKPEGATGAVRSFPLLGRNVPVVPTKDGLRAVSKGEIAKPGSVARHLAAGLAICRARRLMFLESDLGQLEANRRNLHGGPSFRFEWSMSPPLWHVDACGGWGRPSH